MSILLTMNEHRLQSLCCVVCFAHAEHNLIKIKLYNNWSAQVVNSICVLTVLTVNSSYRSVLCEIQRNQSNLVTFKN